MNNFTRFTLMPALCAAALLCAPAYGTPVSGQPPATTEAASPQPPAEKPSEQLKKKMERYKGTGEFLYERPTVEKFSQLYWALGKFDLKDDRAVDYFLMINECDIYTAYFHDEFEWNNIREVGREFLKDNIPDFSLRYDLTLPLKLGKFNVEKNQFDILKDYKIEGLSRFEILAENYEDPVCGYVSVGRKKPIQGYPRALFVELNRPIVLTRIAVKPEMAKQYMEEKTARFLQLPAFRRTESSLYDLRDAYLVLKVKFFAFKDEKRDRSGVIHANMMALLEGIEIYGDQKKKQLFYAEDYKMQRDARMGGGASLTGGEPEIYVPDPNPNHTGEALEEKPPARPEKIEIPGYAPNDGE